MEETIALAADGWGKLKDAFNEACESINVRPHRYDLECVEPDEFHFEVNRLMGGLRNGCLVIPVSANAYAHLLDEPPETERRPGGLPRPGHGRQACDVRHGQDWCGPGRLRGAEDDGPRQGVKRRGFTEIVKCWR